MRGRGQSSRPSGASQQNDSFARDVPINDAHPDVRHTLTKRSVQDDIQIRTSTIIVTKGRYYAPGTPMDPSNPPIHLRITPNANAGMVSFLNRNR